MDGGFHLAPCSLAGRPGGRRVSCNPLHCWYGETFDRVLAAGGLLVQAAGFDRPGFGRRGRAPAARHRPQERTLDTFAACAPKPTSGSRKGRGPSPRSAPRVWIWTPTISTATLLLPDPDNPIGPYVRRDGQGTQHRSWPTTALNTMCDAVFTLGGAAFLLDNPPTARRRAGDPCLVHQSPDPHEPRIGLRPSVPQHRGPRPGIVEGRGFVRAVQGMEFLENTGAWDPREQMAVRNCSRLPPLAGSQQERRRRKERRDDHASWWAAQVAAVAGLNGDADLADGLQLLSRLHFPARSAKWHGAPQESSHPVAHLFIV